MNTRAWTTAFGAALLFVSCEQGHDVSIPQFENGGLLATGTPLTREQLYGFEGFFTLPEGSSLFGPDVSVRTSAETISVLSDKNAGYAVLGAACLPDQSVVLEGYWQYPTRTNVGLVRLFVEPAELGEALCAGEPLDPAAGLSLRGAYGEDDELPTTALSLDWARELKPWRGRFFTVSHHGACEITDHCGATPNSLESIRLSERVGSNAAEVDVRVTRDGVPILFHDPSLSSSLVDGLFCNGKVADLSLAELQGSCRLRHGELIPTLEEALTMMIEQTELEAVYLDQKVPEGVLPSARIVARMMEDLRERNGRSFAALIALTTEEIFDAWQPAKAALTEEGLAIPPCLIEYDPDLVISEGCLAWGPTWTEGPQAGNVAKVRAAGAATVFWTINQSEFIDAFLKEAQPNGIISSRASLLFHRYQKIGTPPPEGPVP
jgi:glycerophosphoryl diester phosphodiesterase